RDRFASLAMTGALLPARSLQLVALHLRLEGVARDAQEARRLADLAAAVGERLTDQLAVEVATQLFVVAFLQALARRRGSRRRRPTRAHRRPTPRRQVLATGDPPEVLDA